MVDTLAALTIGRNGIGTKQEQRLLRGKLDALPDHIMKLSHRQIRGHQIFLLVNVGYVRSIGLLANHRDAVGVFGADALGLRLSLLYAIKEERAG